MRRDNQLDAGRFQGEEAGHEGGRMDETTPRDNRKHEKGPIDSAQDIEPPNLEGEKSSGGNEAPLDRDEIITLLNDLKSNDYFAFKDRTKADDWYEQGRSDFSNGFHGQGAWKEEKVREIEKRLEALLGPRGKWLVVDDEPREVLRQRARELPAPEVIAVSSFIGACFYARYPNWASHSPDLVRAYEEWRDDPRFLLQSPRFRPINPDWFS
jgi:hypothetical protein